MSSTNLICSPGRPRLLRRRGFGFLPLVLVLGCLLFGNSCKRTIPVELADQQQILHLDNGAESEGMDPHFCTGVQEYNILLALLEGLINQDPVDLHPVPGVADRWDISPDGTVYTFHIRDTARWSNGEPLTARDFVQTYERSLNPAVANQYASFMFCLKNAEDYNKGTLKDFSQVGVHALDKSTLQLTLNYPIPYFLSFLTHYTWFPLPISHLAKFGSIYAMDTKWNRPGSYVGNGPFVLTKWRINQEIVVRKNTNYWDAQTVRLQEIHFHPFEALDAAERAFRSGQIHKTDKLPLTKIENYKKNHPEVLLNFPYLGNYFYSFNTTNAPFNDKRVRQALSLAIDREAITKNVARGGELPAFSLVPPNTAGYNSSTHLQADIPKARKLLAEAGFPNGAGFPKVELLYNTLESHKTIAEAVQQMWKKNLGIDISLRNEEWKVFLQSKKQGNYQVARYGWIADYVDPSAFLDMWVTDAGNNDAFWSNAEYDRLIQQASRTLDQAERFRLLQQAEAIFLEEMPIMPLYYYATVYLLRPSVKGWYPTLLDQHPYNKVYLEPLPKSAQRSKSAQSP